MGIVQVLDEKTTLPMESLSRDLRDFLEQCLIRDPHKRPTAHALLSHPFLAQVNVDKLSEQSMERCETSCHFSLLPSRALKKKHSIHWCPRLLGLNNQLLYCSNMFGQISWKAKNTVSSIHVWTDFVYNSLLTPHSDIMSWSTHAQKLLRVKLSETLMHNRMWRVLCAACQKSVHPEGLLGWRIAKYGEQGTWEVQTTSSSLCPSWSWLLAC